MTTKKVYLAHPISTTGEFNDSIRVANLLRENGFEVYAAAENKKINDKSNQPEPKDIYDGDMSELLSSDIVVANITGGHADGTIMEIGAVAGYNELFNQDYEYAEYVHPIVLIGYTSNARMLQPQFYEGVPSASANHLVLGAVQKWGDFVRSEAEMLEKLKTLK